MRDDKTVRDEITQKSMRLEAYKNQIESRLKQYKPSIENDKALKNILDEAYPINEEIKTLSKEAKDLSEKSKIKSDLKENLNVSENNEGIVKPNNFFGVDLNLFGKKIKNFADEKYLDLNAKLTEVKNKFSPSSEAFFETQFKLAFESYQKIFKTQLFEAFQQEVAQSNSLDSSFNFYDKNDLSNQSLEELIAGREKYLETIEKFRMDKLNDLEETFLEDMGFNKKGNIYGHSLNASETFYQAIAYDETLKAYESEIVNKLEDRIANLSQHELLQERYPNQSKNEDAATLVDVTKDVNSLNDSYKKLLEMEEFKPKIRDLAQKMHDINAKLFTRSKVTYVNLATELYQDFKKTIQPQPLRTPEEILNRYLQYSELYSEFLEAYYRIPTEFDKSFYVLSENPAIKAQPVNNIVGHWGIDHEALKKSLPPDVLTSKTLQNFSKDFQTFHNLYQGLKDIELALSIRQTEPSFKPTASELNALKQAILDCEEAWGVLIDVNPPSPIEAGHQKVIAESFGKLKDFYQVLKHPPQAVKVVEEPPVLPVEKSAPYEEINSKSTLSLGLILKVLFKALENWLKGLIVNSVQTTKQKLQDQINEGVDRNEQPKTSEPHRDSTVSTEPNEKSPSNSSFSYEEHRDPDVDPIYDEGLLELDEPEEEPEDVHRKSFNR